MLVKTSPSKTNTQIHPRKESIPEDIGVISSAPQLVHLLTRSRVKNTYQCSLQHKVRFISGCGPIISSWIVSAKALTDITVFSVHLAKQDIVFPQCAVSNILTVVNFTPGQPRQAAAWKYFLSYKGWLHIEELTSKASYRLRFFWNNGSYLCGVCCQRYSTRSAQIFTEQQENQDTLDEYQSRGIDTCNSSHPQSCSGYPENEQN